MSAERQPTYPLGCSRGPDDPCPCQQRRLTDWPVFSTGVRKALVERGPDYTGLLLSEARLARTRFFEWSASA